MKAIKGSAKIVLLATTLGLVTLVPLTADAATVVHKSIWIQGRNGQVEHLNKTVILKKV
jgi:hypothetical protein